MEKIRCLCRSTQPTDSMVKCQDPRCNVWQHIACVLIPEDPMKVILPNPPDIFYCEICRLSRADPFWETVAHPLYPVKLNATNGLAHGLSSFEPIQVITETFQLTGADKDLLLKQEYDVQAWCMLLNDKGTFQMQWPDKAYLVVNGNTSQSLGNTFNANAIFCFVYRKRIDFDSTGVDMSLVKRPGAGANGRDDGFLITTCTKDGSNEISLAGIDPRMFCMGVRIVRRRTLHQVLKMIPKEVEGECFEDALARVHRCVGGGADTENADSDSDIEIVADFVPVTLCCPISGLRIKVAARFKHCAHLACFDLEVFVKMNERTKKWQCPFCGRNYSLEDIIIDPYFNRITSKMQNCGEDVREIEVKRDGSWRAKAEGDGAGLGELGKWHLPDSSISAESRLELETIEEEVGSHSRTGLRLRLKKNKNGRWEFC